RGRGFGISRRGSTASARWTRPSASTSTSPWSHTSPFSCRPSQQFPPAAASVATNPSGNSRNSRPEPHHHPPQGSLMFRKVDEYTASMDKLERTFFQLIRKDVVPTDVKVGIVERIEESSIDTLERLSGLRSVTFPLLSMATCQAGRAPLQSFR